MSRPRTTVCAIVALLWLSAPARAQNDRRALIGRAAAEFDAAAGAHMLMEAMAPGLGAPDSLWATAGYDLAAVLIQRLDREQLADVVLRMVARHAPTWPIDRLTYPPSVVNAFTEAARAVAAQSDADETGIVSDSWRWPASFDLAARGSLEISSTDPAARLSLTIPANGQTAADGRLDLAPGSYTLVAAADGYETVQVTREVLPGVTTRLTVEAVPALSAELRDAIAASLLRITLARGTQQVCGTGFWADADGLVLTSYSLVRGGTALRVSSQDGTESFDNVSIAEMDTTRNLAVLKVGTSADRPVSPATGLASARYAWSVHLANCTDPTAVRARLAAAAGQAIADVGRRLSSPLPEAALGSPVIDRDGRWIAMVTDAASLASAAVAQDVVDRARRKTVTVQIPSAGGGGFPWKWVAAGAGVAGVAVAVLGASGGSGSGSTPPPATTGGIVITIPN